MLIKRRQGWEIPESQATPEGIFLNRRAFLSGTAALGASIATSAMLPGRARAETDPSAHLYPAERNEAFVLDRAVTPEEINSTYNNFYEFGSHKQIYTYAQKLPIRPWEVRIDGMVDEEMTLGIDELLARVSLEERLYRHRCVEAWAMAIPWSGFALADLVRIASPKAGAKYLAMETFFNPDVASGQRQSWNPWPYTEAVTMAEATNDLAFLVTGAYGKPLAKQFGAPLRLALPWKYGFKSIKSIVRFTFTDVRPQSFWEKIGPSEYGFWANVNPDVPHPRWSQASERILGTNETVPTQLFNGYGEQVAGMYAGLDGEKLFM
ncbi:protein-methionine-sulfoxide reductase catalytic subunit MsrP [Breoghania sp. L-A4]|uniref:protein-methionine-sulfoxide reductase catalytic subunit MsrP n=1 Tax=Breoghania sp. L-A4 TaxID=2304600 RepID=UPI000E360B03|nr:protein-methionine-sulfoxide reductase catalytic subunit MsrP [Breoghania sp. L-A4]AXS42048.1 protein-methionine-sulfoxide reductase catalytic subunit MsrP [Breoghania sp. L-A4]